MIEFIFMLTKDDRTIVDAIEVLDSVSDVGLRYVGFKDVGAEPDRQREITKRAHDLGMEVMLEVVSTSVEAEANSVRSARAAEVDWVLGGTNPEVGVDILAGTDIRYCPFPGIVTGHPSVLSGSVEDIAASAGSLSGMKGVYGVDLLTYRHADADPEELTSAVVKSCEGPVIAAGAVVTRDQIELLDRAGAWGFTIGSAVFNGQMPGAPSVAAQVQTVLGWLKDS
jgi:DhnA family fructose-bisphosphate aldolase class Ia